MTDRRLVVMRHAKAEPFASSDHVRALTDRGVADAVAAGRHLAATGVVPDHVVVSSAARTRQTWAAVADGAGIRLAPQVDNAAYTGGPDVVLETLRTVPADRSTVAFVGHNPTAGYLCHLLDDGDGTPEAISGMLRGFPTSALVVFEIEVPWAGLEPGAGRVVDFHAPRR